jgi:Cu(I)/Ag(I) efflux system membrane fusion protein
VPNEAIIEEGDTRVVYRQSAGGQYEPTPVQTGVQGELYTQVTGGLKDGDQVVTFGSFFIDSEFKLKGTAQGQR